MARQEQSRGGAGAASGAIGPADERVSGRSQGRWIAISKNGRFAYATNTGSSSVTGYRISHDGTLEVLDADGVTGSTGAGSAPIDAAFSRDGRFLYVLSGGTNDITTFRQHADGSLTNLGAVGGLPAGAAGLAAR
jgi:6-phosphogluconolactonase (cycloisomerase 2 family)